MTSPQGPAGAGLTVHRHDVLGSTSDEARRLAEAGAPSGTVVLARRQTGGRGRLGRSWVSPEGNVFLSYVHASRQRPEALSGLTLDAGTAVAEVLVSLGLEARLKWPNDVLIGGRKVAGVLTELVSGPRGPVAIVGIGVNVALTEADLPPELRGVATSVGLELGDAAPEAEDLALRIAGRLRERLAAFESRGAPDLAAYEHHFGQRGQTVRFLGPRGPADGVVEGLAPDGGLVVRARGDAAPTIIRTGEVTPVADGQQGEGA